MSPVQLYVGVVFVIGYILKNQFKNSSQRVLFGEIPNQEVLEDLVIAIRLAREHGDLRREHQLYYCLMKVFRYTDTLLEIGSDTLTGFGVSREKEKVPPICAEPDAGKLRPVETGMQPTTPRIAEHNVRI